MAGSFRKAIRCHRAHYRMGNNSPISDNEIHEIIKATVTHIPPTFSSQPTRVVLLLDESHKKSWKVVKNTLRKTVPAEACKTIEAETDNSSKVGCDTVLFLEGAAAVEGLRRQLPSYRDGFPVWSRQISVMHQFVI